MGLQLRVPLYGHLELFRLEECKDVGKCEDVGLPVLTFGLE